MSSFVKSVVFDLDGVLIDSRPCMDISWAMVRAKYSLKQSFDEYVSNIGIPFLDILKAIGVDNNTSNIKDDYLSQLIYVQVFYLNHCR